MRIGWALAPGEGRRLLKSPAFLFGVLLFLMFLPMAIWEPDDQGDFLSWKYLVGAGLTPVALGTAWATSLATTRDRRAGVDQLTASLPSSPQARIVGNLLAVLWGAAVGLAGLAVMATVFRVDRGLTVPDVGRGVDLLRLDPGVAGLAQGPLLIVLAGVTGVALGALFGRATIASVLLAAGFYVQQPAVLWWTWDWRRWLLPVVHGLETRGSVDLSGGGWAIDVRGYDAEGMVWHALYVIALTAVVAGLLLGVARRKNGYGT